MSPQDKAPDPFLLDGAGLDSVRVLIAVAEQIVGPRTMVVRELQNLTRERSFDAYFRAGIAFNALPEPTRRKIAENVAVVAHHHRDAVAGAEAESAGESQSEAARLPSDRGRTHE